MATEKDFRHIKALSNEFPVRLQRQQALERNPKKNRNLRQSETLANEWYLWAVCRYIVEGDLEGYVSNATESLKITKKMLVAHNKGSNVALYRDWFLLHKLISRSLSLNAIEFASELCDVFSNYKFCADIDTNPFHQYWTLSLISLVNGNKVPGLQFLDKLESEFTKARYDIYLSYVYAMRAIFNSDSAMLLKSLRMLSEVYVKQCRSGQVFPFVENRFFCEYGIGLLILAKHKGMNIEYTGEFFPSDLVSIANVEIKLDQKNVIRSLLSIVVNR